MSNLQNFDTQKLIDNWLKREQEGEQFPVDFDTAWQLAGYFKKANGKRKLVKFKEGIDFCSELSKTSAGGRSSELIKMTCDAFKHFCLLAETEQGDTIRQYFIECEKKWRMVQEQHPEVAADVEQQRYQQELQLLTLRNRNLILETEAKKAELKLLEFRHTITVTCPEPVQQKVLGYQTIERVEYRDRIIKEDEILDDRGGYGITAIQKRFGFTSTAQAWKWLESVGYGKDSGKWEEGIYIREGHKLPGEHMASLERRFQASGRQLFLGE